MPKPQLPVLAKFRTSLLLDADDAPVCCDYNVVHKTVDYHRLSSPEQQDQRPLGANPATKKDEEICILHPTTNHDEYTLLLSMQLLIDQHQFQQTKQARVHPPVPGMYLQPSPTLSPVLTNTY
eukprot:TRINITY_DN34994_c0_g1_i1.p2 TRINITY_DN34994_c0_g1~~TRINITY_DN34994_c0_g1_i1.p2  ORF type:complete len:123 (+),score=7.92 TRINITY_DN34994_c0_g1_i1:275-643(+)